MSMYIIRSAFSEALGGGIFCKSAMMKYNAAQEQVLRFEVLSGQKTKEFIAVCHPTSMTCDLVAKAKELAQDANAWAGG